MDALVRFKNDPFLEQVMNIPLKMMYFVSNMMNFVSKMTDFRAVCALLERSLGH